MTPMQYKRINQQGREKFNALTLLAKRNGMRLSRDTNNGDFPGGYWLHNGETQRHIPFLADVAGWINYLH